MILCLTNLSYKNLSFKKFLNQLKKLEVKNVEIVPSLINKTPYSKNNVKKIRLLLNKSNINIVSFHSIFFKVKMKYSNNEKNINYLVNHFKKVAKLAHQLNVKNLSIGSCPSRHLKGNKINIYNFNLDLFKKFCDVAKNYNIYISLEPVSKKYGVYFLNNIDEVFKFIKKLKKKNIKLLLDTGNCKNEKLDFKKKYIKYKKLINHVQLSNVQIDNFKINTIKKELNFFKKIKFKKTLTIEHFSNSLAKLKLNQRLVEKIIN